MSASYAYDAYGQRLRSVVASGSLVATTAYAYDGLSLLRATTARSDGTTEGVAYLYDAAGAPFAGIYEGSVTTAPVAFFIATTARGDVAELIDASGAPFALYAYDAYGNPGAVLTASTARISAALAEAVARANALRYAGYAYDAYSGLYYLSKRYYDPATAQFLTKDPAKADGEESPYQYCAGDPVGKVDPSGEWAKRYYPVVRTYVSYRILKTYAKQRRKNRDYELYRDLARIWGWAMKESYLIIESKVSRRHTGDRDYSDYCWVDQERYVWMFNAADVISVLPAFKVVSKMRPAWAPVARKAAALAAQKIGKAAVRKLFIRAAEPWKAPLPGTIVYLPPSRVRFGNVPE
ncbi:MAG: RHS repeat-associated core domain-containing protein [Coriobacteriia bacterium]|nr:RHS repeat-associated core domain-containing protein [Coriobacteriia bacterium]